MVKAKSNNSGVFEETQFEKEERKKKKKGKKGAKEPQSALVNRKSTLDDLGDGWLHNTGKTRKESEKCGDRIFYGLSKLRYCRNFRVYSI